MTRERPLRADAARKKERVLEVARRLFAASGTSVTFDQVAEEAGVSPATIYRRFPTKTALIEAALEHSGREYSAIIEAAAEIDDAWESFAALVTHLAELQVTNRAVAELIVSAPPTMSGPLQQGARHGWEVAGEIVRRAQAAGALRIDFRVQDLVLISMAVAGLIERIPDAIKPSAGRVVAFVLDGLRADAARTPTSTGPSLEAVWRAMERG